MQVNNNITLVDDDEAVCHVLSVLLEDNGYRVGVYHSAETCLEAEKDATEGIMLLDQYLKGMTGLELQAELKRRGIAVPIILMAGLGDDQVCVEAVKAGAVACLKKPFTNADLLESVTKAFSVALFS